MTQQMRVLATACLFAACATPVWADLINGRDYFGDWMFSSEDNSGSPLCEMFDYQARKDGDGTIALGVGKFDPTNMFISVNRPSWTIPDKTSVGLKLVFPAGSTYEAVGVGHGSTMSLAMPKEYLSRFFQDLATKDRMTVEFRGDEPPWNLGIDGAEKAIAALRTCVKDRGFSDVPAALAGGARTPGPTRPY